MSKKTKKSDKVTEKQTEKAAEGLELLDDETLAAIVGGDVLANGELQTERGQIAFSELAKRSGYYVSK